MSFLTRWAATADDRKAKKLEARLEDLRRMADTSSAFTPELLTELQQVLALGKAELVPCDPALIRGVSGMALTDIKGLLNQFRKTPDVLAELIRWLIKSIEQECEPKFPVYSSALPGAPPGLQALLFPLRLWISEKKVDEIGDVVVSVDEDWAGSLEEGSRVEARYRGGGAWYPGVITDITYDLDTYEGCYTVRWEDGDTQDTKKSLADLRPEGSGRLGGDRRAQRPPPGTVELMVDPLLSMADLQQHITRRCMVSNHKYTEHCEQMVGSRIELAPTGNGLRSSALVVGVRVLGPGLPLVHCLAYPDSEPTGLSFTPTPCIEEHWLAHPEVSSSRLVEHVLAGQSYHVLLPEARPEGTKRERLARALWAANYAGVPLHAVLTQAADAMSRGASLELGGEIGVRSVMEALGGRVTGRTVQFGAGSAMKLLSEALKSCNRVMAAQKPAAVAAPEPSKYRWTVAVVCPEGVPADLFLMEVVPMLSQVLGQALRSTPQQLGWPEGWDQMITSVQVGVAETTMGVVARGQTHEEALQVQGALHMCMSQLWEDDQHSELREAIEAATPQPGGLFGQPVEQAVQLGERVHVRESVCDGTVLQLGEEGQVGVVTDDGVFLGNLPASAVQSDGGVQRYAQSRAPLAEKGSTPSLLRRALSAFERDPSQNTNQTLELAAPPPISDQPSMSEAPQLYQAPPALEVHMEWNGSQPLSAPHPETTVFEALTRSNNKSQQLWGQPLELQYHITTPDEQSLAAACVFSLSSCVGSTLQISSTAIPWRSQELKSELSFSDSCLKRGWDKARVALELIRGCPDGWIEQVGLAVEPETLNWARLLSLARMRGGYPAKKLSTRHSQLSRQATSAQNSGLCGVGAETQMAIDAVIAMRRALHSAPHLSSKIKPQVWISDVLSNKMRAQIEDTLTMATNALPDWFVLMPRTLPYLFPLELRLTVFRSMAFGMSHSLWWMQEELTRRQFGPQIQQARAAVAQAQQKNQDNQVKLYRCSALLKFLEQSHTLNQAIAEHQRTIDKLLGKSPQPEPEPELAAGSLGSMGYMALKRLMAASGFDKNRLMAANGKGMLLEMFAKEDPQGFRKAGQLPPEAVGAPPEAKQERSLSRAEKLALEAERRAQAELAEQLEIVRTELESNFKDFSEGELKYSSTATSRLKDQIAQCTAAMQQLAMNEGQAWEPVWEIEDQERAMRMGHKLLRSTTVVLERENILEEANQLLEQRSGSKARLEIKWSGEQAFGHGVTQSFYSEVAKALQKRDQFQGLWGPEGLDAKEASEYLHCPAGFFPRPAMECTVETANTFRMLGNLMATATRDGFVVPLHISPYFFALVVGDQHDLSSVGQRINAVRTLGTVGQRYAALWSLCCRCSRPVNASQVAELGQMEFYQAYLKQDAKMSLEDYLDCMEDSDPLTGQPLWPDGDDRVAQLHDTIPRICDLWLGEAITGQVCAFRTGIDQVFKVDALSAFTMSELKDLLCGHEEVNWDERELLKHLLPTGGYSKSSKHFKWICKILDELDHPSRRLFLDFATAMPMLPPDGLASLNLEISKPPHRKTAAIYPTAMTCVPKLFLPEYNSIDEMRERLGDALQGFSGFDDRVGNAQAFEVDIAIPEQVLQQVSSSYSS